MIRISTIDGKYFINGKQVKNDLEHPIKIRLLLEHFKDVIENQEIKIKSSYYEQKN